MWERMGRGFAAVVAVVATLTIAAPAGAKVLPIASVSVSTPTPTVGKRFAVTVRFRPGGDFIDAGWENVEVFLLPAARTDAQGWPLTFDDRGKAVPIHRVGHGVFRGTAVVRTPGDYVVIDSSALDARADRAEGIIVTGTYAKPVRLHVARAASGSSFPWLPVGSGAALVVVLLAVTRARRRRVEPAAEPEELVYAGR